MVNFVKILRELHQERFTLWLISKPEFVFNSSKYLIGKSILSDLKNQDL